jgi:MarR family transcriptional regulator, organic hydroperoxide resistance regulator
MADKSLTIFKNDCLWKFLETFYGPIWLYHITDYLCGMFRVNDTIGYKVAMCTKFVTSRLAELFDEHGIDMGHPGWVVLTRLWEEDGITQQELSLRSGVAKPNMSNYIDLVERKGYVERRSDESDDRNKLIFLTKRGKELKTISVKLGEQVNDELCKNLTNAERKQFHQLLRKIHP